MAAKRVDGLVGNLSSLASPYWSDFPLRGSDRSGIRQAVENFVFEAQTLDASEFYWSNVL
jgi:hypothetical protein